MKTFLIILASVFIFTSFVNIPEYMEPCHWRSCPDFPVTSIVTYYPNYYNMHELCGGPGGYACSKLGWNIKMLSFDALLAVVVALSIFGVIKIIYKVRNRDRN